MYSTSIHHPQGGIKAVVDLALSNVPRSPHSRGTANGLQRIKAKSFIKGRVEYSAESAAGEIADHPDFTLGQIKDLGGLVADAGGELGRGVDGQAVLAPVGDDTVRLHGHVGLDLRAVLAVDDDIGLGQSLLGVAPRPAESLSGVRA